jgi:alpha-amylase/alpha-mannosidase (GH57 family)
MTTSLPARRSFVIHAHFYQPPREDPWLDLVPREPNAAPWHDWNQRIERECYRAVAAARIPGAEGYIKRIVNTLLSISYNVGPTLLEWMEHQAPETYRAFIAADRISSARTGGLGNAIAMPYHHVILPLASHREKTTEVEWGIADFRRRFGRAPVGMWLPETAVDDDTLDVLAAAGIAFTILAPHQVVERPPRGLPGRYRTAAGRSIAVFLYDGPLSHDVAFGPLVKSAELWVRRMLEPAEPEADDGVVAIATDGETYGHHHRFGEMALAAVLEALKTEPGARVENFASVLARQPAVHPVQLVEPTSWSCEHGVERWRSDCGCRLTAGTSQTWRGPLRAALDWLAEELHAIFAEEACSYFADPWAARTAFGTLGAPSDLEVRARELLELERGALRMFTSCAWFFDDVAGVETIQVLRYAARAIELAGSAGARLEAGFLLRLERARSNDTTKGTAADVYRSDAKPRWSGEERVAAGFAALSVLSPGHVRHVIGAFLVGAIGESVVQTQHRRTGHVERFATTVHRPGTLALEVDLTRAESDRTRTLGLDALPERERTLAREVLRREALREVFTPEELVRLAHGAIDYPTALRDSIVRIVPERPGDLSAVTASRLERALDLLAVEDLSIPFDAQTRFFRLMTSGDPIAVVRLKGLATRMGFTRDAFDD